MGHLLNCLKNTRQIWRCSRGKLTTGRLADRQTDRQTAYGDITHLTVVVVVIVVVVDL